MQIIPIYLNIDGHVATPMDAYNAVRNTPPALMRGVRALLCLRLVDDDGNPDDSDITALANWEFVLAGDWNTATDPEIRVTSGITIVKTTVGTKTYNEIQIPLTELNTEELISKLGNNPSADLGAELVGFEAGETDPGFLIQFTMRVYNRRSTAGTGTPTPVADGLYSAVQIDSLLTQYYTSVQVDAKLSGYALTTHNHDAVYAAISHTHAISEVVNLQASLDAKADATTVNTHLADVDIHTSTTERAEAVALGHAVQTHMANTENPHVVTKSQIGLGNVDNTADMDKPVSIAQQTVFDAKADAVVLNAHLANTENPHAVTQAQVGLGKVDNTSDADKPVSTAQQTALDGKAAISHNHDAAYAAKSSEHTHANLAVLDKFSEDTSGSPLYNGKSIVGSSSSGGALLSSDFFAVNPVLKKTPVIGGGGSFTGGLTGIVDYATAIYQDFLTSTYQTA